MKIIDFDAKFTEILTDWIEKNRSRFRRPEDMEDEVPDVYLKFLNTPEDWLDGKTPGEYFDQFDDSQALCDLVCDYIRDGVPVQDPLLDRLEELADEPTLLKLALNKQAPCEARMTAIGLLREMESTQPKMLYIDWQMNRPDRDDLCDNALDSLKSMGACVVQPLLEALPKANAAGQEAMLDVLADYPGNEQVFQLALRLFRENRARRALFASYLGKLGDDRALPDLIEAAGDEKTGYIDFIELRNAIEMLGGVAPDREFDNDPDYDALHGMDQ